MASTTARGKISGDDPPDRTGRVKPEPPSFGPEQTWRVCSEERQDTRLEGSQGASLVEPKSKDEVIQGPHGPDIGKNLGVAPREEVQRFQVTLDPEITETIRQMAREQREIRQEQRELLQEQRELRAGVKGLRHETLEVKAIVEAHGSRLDHLFQRTGDIADGQRALRAGIDELKQLQRAAIVQAQGQAPARARTPMKTRPISRNIDAGDMRSAPSDRVVVTMDVESIYASDENDGVGLRDQSGRGHAVGDAVEYFDVEGRQQEAAGMLGEERIRNRQGLEQRRCGLGTEEAMERWDIVSEVSGERGVPRQRGVQEFQLQGMPGLRTTRTGSRDIGEWSRAGSRASPGRRIDGEESLGRRGRGFPYLSPSRLSGDWGSEFMVLDDSKQRLRERSECNRDLRAEQERLDRISRRNTVSDSKNDGRAEVRAVQEGVVEMWRENSQRAAVHPKTDRPQRSQVSGSSAPGAIGPDLVQVRDTRACCVERPIPLQPGTTGSHSSVNYGTWASVELGDELEDRYHVDVVNIDRYDAGLGAVEVVLPEENDAVLGSQAVRRGRADDRRHHRLHSGVVDAIGKPLGCLVDGVGISGDPGRISCGGYHSVPHLYAVQASKLQDTIRHVVAKARSCSKRDVSNHYDERTRVEPGDGWMTMLATIVGTVTSNIIQGGDRNAPSTFQGFITHRFTGNLARKFMHAYLNNMFIFLDSIMGYQERGKSVVNRLCESGMVLNPRECDFFSGRIDWLPPLGRVGGVWLTPTPRAGTPHSPTVPIQPVNVDSNFLPLGIFFQEGGTGGLVFSQLRARLEAIRRNPSARPREVRHWDTHPVDLDDRQTYVQPGQMVYAGTQPPGRHNPIDRQRPRKVIEAVFFRGRVTIILRPQILVGTPGQLIADRVTKSRTQIDPVIGDAQSYIHDGGRHQPEVTTTTEFGQLLLTLRPEGISHRDDRRFRVEDLEIEQETIGGDIPAGTPMTGTMETRGCLHRSQQLLHNPQGRQLQKTTGSDDRDSGLKLRKTTAQRDKLTKAQIGIHFTYRLATCYASRSMQLVCSFIHLHLSIHFL